MNLAFIQVVIVVTYSIFSTEFDATMQEMAFLAVDFFLAKHAPSSLIGGGSLRPLRCYSCLLQ